MKRWKVFAVIASIGVLPFVVQHLGQIWANPMYQFFPFVIGFVGYMGWTRWNEAAKTVGPRLDSNWHGELILSAIAFGLLVISYQFYNPWVGMVAFVAISAFAALVALRYRHVCGVLGLWALLWLMVPLPLGLANDFASQLQAVSSGLSGELLDLCRVDYILLGNVIQLSDRDLFVDQACSGIISVMSVVACAAMYCVWQRRSPGVSLIVVVLGVGWAVSLNVVRIFTIALMGAKFNLDLASGWQHEALGLGIFLGTALAIFSTDSLLRWLLGPIPVVAMHGSQGNAIIERWNRRFASNVESPVTAKEPPSIDVPQIVRQIFVSLAILSALVGLAHVAGTVGAIFVSQPTSDDVISVLLERGDAILPVKVDDWVKISYELARRDAGENLRWGKFSHLYRYRNQQTQTEVSVSIDFPFVGEWHELSGCYRATGWVQRDRRVDNAEYLVAAVFDSEVNRDTGYLFFSLCNISGKWLPPPVSSSIMDRAYARLKRRRPSLKKPTLIQVQVFGATARPLPNEQQVGVKSLFVQAREYLRMELQEEVDSPKELIPVAD